MPRLDLSDYDPEPARRPCRRCQVDPSTCRDDRCGCTSCEPDEDEENDMADQTHSPSNPQYPDVHVQLTGQSGNAFAIIGAVSRALRREVGADAATQFTSTAMEQESYDALLRFAMSTVNVS